MMVFRPGDEMTLKAGPQGARLMVLGGATLNEKRDIWWNFMMAPKDRIEQAQQDWNAADWANALFKLSPQDGSEFIRIDPAMNRTKPKEWT